MNNRTKLVLFVMLISITFLGNLVTPRYRSTTSKIEETSQILSKGIIIPIVNDKQANNYTTGVQGGSSVSALTDDKFVVAWSSEEQDGDGYGVYASVFDVATGANLTKEFKVNAYTTDNQGVPSVSALTNDKFVMAWVSDGQDGDNYEVFASVFDATTGENLTKEFKVNTYTINDQSNPSVSTLTDDKFVVAWESYGQDGDYYGVYASIFDAIMGENLTKEFQVNTYTTSYQEYPSVSALTDDKFVVTWESYGQDGSDEGIFFSEYIYNEPVDGIPGFGLFYILGGLVLIAIFYIIYIKSRTNPKIGS